jgi:threonine synthase
MPAGAEPVSLGEGNTPVIAYRDSGGKAIYLKLENLSPSGSFKDRGMAVLVSLARHLGVEAVICDSSGNAGASVAAYCAAVSLPCRVFVPKTTSEGKLRQIRDYGAELVGVRGDRQAVAVAAQSAASRNFYASHYWNPFFMEGTKTFALELFGQLGDRMPDHVVFAVGHGSLFLGAVIGFEELAYAHGLRLPRCHVIQAEACRPIVDAFETSSETASEAVAASVDATGSTGTETIAEGIRISRPLRLSEILAALRKTSGCALAVDDGRIRATHRSALERGVLLEPTSAAALSGIELLRERRVIGEGEVVVAPVTGNGLKTS